MRVDLNDETTVNFPTFVTVKGVLFSVMAVRVLPQSGSWFWPVEIDFKVKSRKYAVVGTLYDTEDDKVKEFVEKTALKALA